MSTAIEDLFRKTLVYIGDLNRMETRLDALRNEAKKLEIEIEDLPKSEKTIDRLKNEANVLHNQIDTKLDGA